jgi:hypothetical protein
MYRLLRRCNPRRNGINITEYCNSKPCKDNEICQDIINGYKCNCQPGFSGNNCEIAPRDCAEIKRWQPYAISGVYTVQIRDDMAAQRVYCDMATHGGGWLVIQRRQDGSENFYRPWVEYAAGFGDVTREFWLGNDNIAALTSSGRYGIRVDLVDRDGIALYAEFDKFTVGSASTKYKLFKVGTYSGNAGDALSFHWNSPFSTYDQDNDAHKINCAELMRGGWWYFDCIGANLNGQYNMTGKERGVLWLTIQASAYSQKFVEMKIRPVNFK